MLQNRSRSLHSCTFPLRSDYQPITYKLTAIHAVCVRGPLIGRLASVCMWPDVFALCGAIVCFSGAKASVGPASKSNDTQEHCGICQELLNNEPHETWVAKSIFNSWDLVVHIQFTYEHNISPFLRTSDLLGGFWTSCLGLVVWVCM